MPAPKKETKPETTTEPRETGETKVEPEVKTPPKPKQGKALSGSKDPGGSEPRPNLSHREKFRARLRKDGAQGKVESEMTRFDWLKNRLHRHREE